MDEQKKPRLPSTPAELETTVGQTNLAIALMARSPSSWGASEIMKKNKPELRLYQYNVDVALWEPRTEKDLEDELRQLVTSYFMKLTSSAWARKLLKESEKPAAFKRVYLGVVSRLKKGARDFLSRLDSQHHLFPTRDRTVFDFKKRLTRERTANDYFTWESPALYNEGTFVRNVVSCFYWLTPWLTPCLLFRRGEKTTRDPTAVGCRVLE